MTSEETPGALRLNTQLGQGSEAREMAAFVAWAVKKYGQHAYRHTSATSGEWAAWQAATMRERERCAKIAETVHPHWTHIARAIREDQP